MLRDVPIDEKLSSVMLEIASVSKGSQCTNIGMLQWEFDRYCLC
jgi:hypothetical protein